MQTQHTIDYTLLTRQDLTNVACDSLASEGKKPSVPLVRERTMQLAGIKRGSDGDVQKDIQHSSDEVKLRHSGRQT